MCVGTIAFVAHLQICEATGHRVSRLRALLYGVLVVAGAGATAMCADLGSRTIREELDALRVLGINPIQALVVPRVLAATVVSLLLAGVVILTGLLGSFVFSVFVQHVTPGAFAAGITLHMRSLSGKNGHHVIEASFKGVARCLRDSIRVESAELPSTKGTL